MLNPDALPLGKTPQDIANEIVWRYRQGMLRWQGMRQRQTAILALVNGYWQTVFPNDVSDTELPMVANIFRTTTEDGGRMFAEQQPFERVFPTGLGQTDTAAELKERIVNSYTQRSNMDAKYEYFGMDMIACGYAAIKCWPDMGMGISRRFPKFHRIHPMNVLPEVTWRPDEASDNIMVHYPENITRLLKEFPAEIAPMVSQIANDSSLSNYGYDLESLFVAKNRPATMMVLDWYSSEFIARVALHSAEGRDHATLLTYMENKTEICPVQLAYRPSWGSEPIGQLDDSKGIIQGKNRMWRMLLDYFVEMVYGGKVSWNIQNPYDRGPGVVYRALGPDGKLESVAPNIPSFQAFNMINESENEARTSSVSPAAREGDLNLNKATGTFLRGAQGQLYSNTKSQQRNFASAKRHANEAAFAQDETWCNAKKKISGLARGRRFEDEYTPSDAIAGDYSNVVSYGTASGLDVPTQMVLLENKRATKSMSLETFLEQDPTIEDVPAEISRLRSEAVEEAFVMSLTDPNRPPQERDAALKVFKKGGSVEDAIDAMDAARAAQPTMAQVLAGGGAPGGGPGPTGPAAPAAPGLPGAGSSPLPPLPPLQSLRTPRVVPGGQGPRAPQVVRRSPT